MGVVFKAYRPVVGTTSSKGATGFEASSWLLREEYPNRFCHIFRCSSHPFQLKLQLFLIHITSCQQGGFNKLTSIKRHQQSDIKKMTSTE